MKAIEFETELTGNQIPIPDDVQLKLTYSQDRFIRVILLIEESDDVHDDHAFRQLAKDQFLKGYAESDLIYDD